ncbi:MAG: alpha,alpha-trehalose phosphorylase [Clostridiales bacterium]|nr:alpha,alpha-trehalose phosphorylase [Clostridiales bacterium]
MEEGYTKRELVWESREGEKIAISIKRMTSFSLLTLFTMEYEVKLLNFDGMVSIASYHIAEVENYSNANDPRLAAERIKNLTVERMEIEGEMSVACSKTSASGLKICSAVAHRVQDMVEETLDKKDGCVVYTASNRGGIHLEKYAVFTDSIRYDLVEEAAKRDLREALRFGLAYYYREQINYLSKVFYQTEVTIRGAEEINQAVNYNLFQLIQSAPRDAHCNIAAKGLSGEGYEGHYFWDTEMFLLPFFTLTNPSLAKRLLSYRYDTLDKARQNARLLGHKKGALYPWRTITGVECSGYFPSGTAQYHIDGDIAYGIVQYYLATKDLAFLLEQGMEMLIETARLWMEVGTYHKGSFVIHAVTGPDEYTCMINNNYYTNCAAKYNLTWAAKLYERVRQEKGFQTVIDRLDLTGEEIAGMKAAAWHMFLPYDEALGINPQDDSFLSKPVWNLEETPKEDFPLLLHYHPLYLYRHQVCKQADTVLAYFLFEEEQAVDVMKRSYSYYEKITTHDSSLSTCVFSIVASRLGMQKKGYDYFGDSAKLDLCNTHGNTKYGIHTANMGGCYMAIVHGFAGLRMKEEGVFLSPFIPEGWEGYEIRFRYQGNLYLVNVARDWITVSLLEGLTGSLHLYGIQYHLEKGKSRTVEYQASSEEAVC